VNPFNLMGAFGVTLPQVIREVYVPNLPREMWGKRFQSEREFLLMMNHHYYEFDNKLVVRP
jgi:hypothetical protein